MLLYGQGLLNSYTVEVLVHIWSSDLWRTVSGNQERRLAELKKEQQYLKFQPVVLSTNCLQQHRIGREATRGYYHKPKIQSEKDIKNPTKVTKMLYF